MNAKEGHAGVAFFWFQFPPASANANSSYYLASFFFVPSSSTVALLFF